jgi:hypothetical protein
MIVSVYNETKWSYPIFAATPPGWLFQFSVAIDEYRKFENQKQRRAMLDARRKSANKVKIV